MKQQQWEEIFNTASGIPWLTKEYLINNYYPPTKIKTMQTIEISVTATISQMEPICKEFNCSCEADKKYSDYSDSFSALDCEPNIFKITSEDPVNFYLLGANLDVKLYRLKEKIRQAENDSNPVIDRKGILVKEGDTIILVQAPMDKRKVVLKNGLLCDEQSGTKLSKFFASELEIVND